MDSILSSFHFIFSSNGVEGERPSSASKYVKSNLSLFLAVFPRFHDIFICDRLYVEFVAESFTFCIANIFLLFISNIRKSYHSIAMYTVRTLFGSRETK